MGEIAKWAILGAALLVLIATITGFIILVNNTEWLPSALSSINEGVLILSPYLAAARRLLNNFFVPQVLSVSLIIVYSNWIWKILIAVQGFITKFIFRG